MKILVTGTRRPLVAEDIRVIENVFRALEPPVFPGDVLVHGDAQGVDRAVAAYAADDLGMEVRAYPADWDKHGKSAGPIRNQLMLEEEHIGYSEGIDLVLAFPDARSRGTWDMVERAVKNRIPVRVYPL